DYWIDNRKTETIPENLQQLLALWKYQPPNSHDFSHINEVFPSASWQYILYGMGFKTQPRETTSRFVDDSVAHRYFEENRVMTNKLISALPTNRELIDKIYQYGMQKV
ncbi:MAG: tryptophan 7-halogenase, partial [Kangiellaceae bacterium]|nr:tryptophan 7-halogenase [Kangiellaceae bacterium]